MDLEKDKLSPVVLHHLLAPIVRETTIADESRAEILSVAKDVANIIKKKMGMEDYARLVSKLQAQFTVKRAERKKQRTREVKFPITVVKYIYKGSFKIALKK